MPASPNLDTIVARMNMSTGYADRVGFIGANVRSYDPPIIAINFDGNSAAEALLMELQVQGFAGRMEIDPLNSATILQHRA